VTGKKREYSSESRRASAELTRKRILAAAKELFAAQGFEKATIAAVAEQAGVSAPSVYAIYKSKEGLLRELVHSAVYGAEYQALVDRVLTASNPLECIHIAASITCLIYESEEAGIGFARGASVVSPALEALEREGEQLRYERQEVVVRRLFEQRAVRPEIDIASARDMLWGLTGRELYRMLVKERGWPTETYKQWLADTLTRVLVKEEIIAASRGAA